MVPKMTIVRRAASALVTAALLLSQGAAASAQRRMTFNEYTPTPQHVVDKMLEVAKVTADDFVLDLGSGDGRIPITAAQKYGARGLGIDIDPKLIALSRANARKAGVADRVEFRQQDMFKTSVHEATVVALYLYAWANAKLRPRLVRELKPGSRIVGHNFGVGGDWHPDIEERVGEENSVYLWYVPAQVAGRWEVTGTDGGFVLHLRQQHQKVEATVTRGSRTQYLPTVRLRGDEIQWTVESVEGKPTVFRGKVTGDTITPHADVAGAGDWRAVRVGKKKG
jgi:SAM-dependent methyltransferase